MICIDSILTGYFVHQQDAEDSLLVTWCDKADGIHGSLYTLLFFMRLCHIGFLARVLPIIRGSFI